MKMKTGFFRLCSISMLLVASIMSVYSSDVSVQIELQEELAEAPAPQFFFRLTVSSQEWTEVTNKTKVDDTHWDLTFTLPESAGNVEEYIEFALTGEDLLGNAIDKKVADTRFSVFKENLTAPEAPVLYGADAVAGGAVELTWSSVPSADRYVVYRGTSENALSVIDSAVSSSSTEYSDDPGSDTTWYYAIAAARDVYSQSITGDISNVHSADRDATVPAAPDGLTVQITSDGASLSWESSTSTDVDHYNVYRGADNADVTALTTLFKADVSGTTDVDSAPDRLNRFYAVTAVDGAGNESVASLSAHWDADALPATTLTVTRHGDGKPVVSWQHPEPTLLDGYILSVGSHEININDNTQTSYEDTAWRSGEQTYSLVPVYSAGMGEGAAKTVHLPDLSISITDDSTFLQHAFSELQFDVRNNGSTQTGLSTLTVARADAAYNAPVPVLASTENTLCTVVVSGPALVADQAVTAAVVRVEQPGVSSTISEAFSVSCDGHIYDVDITHDPLVKGADCDVSFSFAHSSQVRTDVEAARSSGSADSSTVHLELLNADNLRLVSTTYRQVAGANIVRLADSRDVAAVPTAFTFISTPMTLSVPAGAPDDLVLRLTIDQVEYNGADGTTLTIDNPIVVRKSVGLGLPEYIGEITEVTPTEIWSSEPVTVKGIAKDPVSGQPKANKLLNITFSRKHHAASKETVTVRTGSDGTFEMSYTPDEGLFGVYSVAALHESVSEGDAQAVFSYNGFNVAPASVNGNWLVSAPNMHQMEVQNMSTMTFNNVTVELRASDNGGTLPAGLGTNEFVFDVLTQLTSDDVLTLDMTVTPGIESVQTAGTLSMRLVGTMEGAGTNQTLAVIPVTYSVDPQLPVLSFQPSSYQLGVAFEEETKVPRDGMFAVTNMGFVSATNVNFELLDLAENPAPDWLWIQSAPHGAGLPPSQALNVVLRAHPCKESSTNWCPEQGDYDFLLRATADGINPVDMPLFVRVSDGQTGSLHVVVQDIYTGTTAADGSTIPGLADADITLRSTTFSALVYKEKSDANGEYLFEHIPTGRYQLRVSKSGHSDYSTYVWVQPDLTTEQEVFLDMPLVNFSFSVTPITIEDRYEINLELTHETDVPAPVVILDPGSINIKDMQTGEEESGEITIHNYGKIKLRNVKVTLPPGTSDPHYIIKFGKTATQLSSDIGAGETKKLPYTITCVERPATNEAVSLTECVELWGEYQALCGAYRPYKAKSCFFGNQYLPSGAEISVVGWKVTYPERNGGSMAMRKPPNEDGDMLPCNLTIPCPKEAWCCKDKTQSPAGSHVDAISGQFVDDEVDIYTADLVLMRYWQDLKWQSMLDTPTFSFVADPMNSVTVNWDNFRYERVADGNPIFAYQDYELEFIPQSDPLVTSLVYKVNRYHRYWDQRYEYELHYNEKTGWHCFITRWAEHGGDLHFEYENDPARTDNVRNGLTKLNRMTNAGGETLFTLDVDAAGRIVKISDADMSFQLSYTYNAAGKLAVVTNMNGEVYRYSYDDSGRMVRKETPWRKPRNITYSSGGYVKSVLTDDGVGHYYDYGYDAGKKELYFSSEDTRTGDILEYWYDENSLALLAVAQNGVVRYQKQVFGNTEVVTDASGKSTTYVKDDVGRILSREYPDGTTESYMYDATGRKIEYVNRFGVKRTYAYDANGNCIQQNYAVGTEFELVAKVSFHSDGRINVAQVEDASGNLLSSHTYLYDSENRIVGKRDHLGRVEEMTYYDSIGRVTNIVDIFGNTTAPQFDDEGTMTGVMNNGLLIPMPETNELGQVVKTFDVKGVFEEFFYDANGMLTNTLTRGVSPYAMIKDANGKTVEVQYGPWSESLTYDARGRLTRVEESNGKSWVEYGYNDANAGAEDFGCVSCNRDIRDQYIAYEKHPLAYVEYEHDVYGGLVSSTLRLSDTERLRKEWNTSITQRKQTTALIWEEDETIGNGVIPQAKKRIETSIEFDVLGRVSKYVDAMGGQFEIGYNIKGFPSKVTDSMGRTNQFTYGPYGIIEEIAPDGKKQHVGYSANGVYDYTIDRNGRKRSLVETSDRSYSYQYYTSDQDPTPDTVVSFAYNTFGEIAGYTNEHSKIRLSYDQFSMITSRVSYIGGKWYTNSCQYDVRQACTGAKSTHGPQVSFVYNEALLSEIDVDGGGKITITDWIDRYPTRIVYPGGAVQEVAFGPHKNVLTNKLTDADGNVVFYNILQYDGFGRLTNINMEGGVASFEYDDLAQLTKENRKDGSSITYMYDAMGNRLSDGISGGGQYDSRDRLLQLGAASMTYDDHGNMLTRVTPGGTETFVWSLDNRLVSYTGTNGVVTVYEYNPLGQRVSKKVGNDPVTYYVYGNEGLTEEVDSNGNVVRSFAYWPDVAYGTTPLIMKHGGNIYYYVHDFRGYPVVLLNTAGKVVWEGEYSAYGQCSVVIGQVEQPLRGSAQYFDRESGLHYNTARYYDPALGRYISPDPEGIHAGLNLYKYVENNPLAFADVYGTTPCYIPIKGGKYCNSLKVQGLFELKFKAPSPFKFGSAELKFTPANPYLKYGVCCECCGYKTDYPAQWRCTPSLGAGLASELKWERKRNPKDRPKKAGATSVPFGNHEAVYDKVSQDVGWSRKKDGCKKNATWGGDSVCMKLGYGHGYDRGMVFKGKLGAGANQVSTELKVVSRLEGGISAKRCAKLTDAADYGFGDPNQDIQLFRFIGETFRRLTYSQTEVGISEKSGLVVEGKATFDAGTPSLFGVKPASASAGTKVTFSSMYKQKIGEFEYGVIPYGGIEIPYEP